VGVARGTLPAQARTVAVHDDGRERDRDHRPAELVLDRLAGSHVDDRRQYGPIPDAQESDLYVPTGTESN
jgi:hypothetical protein